MAAKYKAVGNGVPIHMARVLADAVINRHQNSDVTLCRCGCGRRVAGRQVMATPACRKRMERGRRDAAAARFAGPVTVIVGSAISGAAVLNAGNGARISS
jgi:hypothetical protein